MTNTEALTTLQTLITKVHDLDDESASDGDGRVDVWQSPELSSLIEQAQQALNVLSGEAKPGRT